MNDGVEHFVHVLKHPTILEVRGHDAEGVVRTRTINFSKVLRIQKIGYGLRILYQGEDGLRRLHSATITNPNPVLLTLKEFQSDGTTKHIKNARLDNYDNYIAPVRPLQ